MKALIYISLVYIYIYGCVSFPQLTEGGPTRGLRKITRRFATRGFVTRGFITRVFVTRWFVTHALVGCGFVTREFLASGFVTRIGATRWVVTRGIVTHGLVARGLVTHAPWGAGTVNVEYRFHILNSPPLEFT